MRAEVANLREVYLILPGGNVAMLQSHRSHNPLEGPLQKCVATIRKWLSQSLPKRMELLGSPANKTGYAKLLRYTFCGAQR